MARLENPNDVPVASANPWLRRLLELLGLLPAQYTVTVTNYTTDVFTEIDVFYKRKGLAGIVFLQHVAVVSGESVVFSLGDCDQMESYVVGFFIGVDLVVQLPATGNITPAIASQLNPSDTDPCADSWGIYG